MEGHMTAATSIAENIARVRAQIAAAAERAGRDPAEVTLIAVSKGFSTEVVADAATAGLSVFGENRVQEAAGKVSELPDSLKWHMIGHVQSNKAKQAAALFDCVQSVDSIKLANALARHAAEQGRCLPILLQVSVTGKESQFGFHPSELPMVARSVAEHSSLRIEGLMTIASFTGDESALRSEFQALRGLRDELKSLAPDQPCQELSMGMSNDYALAIEEGATIVRVGRALFGERPLSAPKNEPATVVQST
jgi:hypothetical protein